MASIEQYSTELEIEPDHDTRFIPSFVYVIQAENGMLKIGQSSEPFKRIRSINLHSPVRCRIVAILKGLKKNELLLHRRFAAARAHHEWFRCEGEVAEFLDAVFGCGVDRVLDWTEVTEASRTTAERRALAHEKKAKAMRALWADPARRAYFLSSKRPR